MKNPSTQCRVFIKHNKKLIETPGNIISCSYEHSKMSYTVKTQYGCFDFGMDEIREPHKSVITQDIPGIGMCQIAVVLET